MLQVRHFVSGPVALLMPVKILVFVNTYPVAIIVSSKPG
jgi:hypothetical protein